MDFDKFAREDQLRKKVDRLYNYLRAKYLKDDDTYKLQLLSKQSIKDKILSGASEIDGVSLGSSNRLGVDTHDYSFQLDYERNSHE